MGREADTVTVTIGGEKCHIEEMLDNEVRWPGINADKPDSAELAKVNRIYFGALKYIATKLRELKH